VDKFLITLKSGNRITGPIMITTSPRSSCPTACPLRKDGDSPEAGVCYAEHGHLGHYIWNGLDKTPAGQKISNRIPVYSFDDLLEVVRAQPEGTLWRHNQAGDLPSADRITIDRARLQRLTAANTGRHGSPTRTTPSPTMRRTVRPLQRPTTAASPSTSAPTRSKKPTSSPISPSRP
jgi:hypothetical protein